MSNTVAELLTEGTRLLGSGEGARESELLLCRAVARDRAWLRAHDQDPVEAAAAERYRGWLRQRADGVPVAYLLGEREFWSLPLTVSPAVLIPRPDTESLVEQALSRIPQDRAVRVADLGTGSGAIALAIASERPQAQVLATDASAQALAVAAGNARQLGLSDRIRFRLGHWYAALSDEAAFDLIVSNPPYIAADDPHLQLGDLRAEPQCALASGADGLDAIRELASGAARHLADGGWLLLEHGHDQGAAVRDLLREAGLSQVETVRDFGGNERVSLGTRK